VQTTTKRMRVAETVSLGEKRFVSIVNVEGREFLIGGGSSGVTLLAQLSPVQQEAGIAAIKNFREGVA
jgi:flagellar biogenesis protein FliO